MQVHYKELELDYEKTLIYPLLTGHHKKYHCPLPHQLTFALQRSATSRHNTASKDSCLPPEKIPYLPTHTTRPFSPKAKQRFVRYTTT